MLFLLLYAVSIRMKNNNESAISLLFVSLYIDWNFISYTFTFSSSLLSSFNFVQSSVRYIESNTGKSARQGNLRHPRVIFQSFADSASLVPRVRSKSDQRVVEICLSCTFWHKLYTMHLPVKRMWFFCLAKIGTRLSQKWEISNKIASVFCFVFCFCFWFFLGGWLFHKTNQTMFLLLRFSQFELNQFIIGAQELSSFVRYPLMHGLRDQNHFCTRLRRDVSQLSINASFFKLPLTEANVKFELLTFC